jgi:hypothetical protein
MILWVSLMRPKWKDREVKEPCISKTALSGFEDVMQGNIQTGNICQYSQSVILAIIGIPFAGGSKPDGLCRFLCSSSTPSTQAAS